MSILFYYYVIRKFIKSFMNQYTQQVKFEVKGGLTYAYAAFVSQLHRSRQKGGGRLIERRGRVHIFEE